MAGSSPMTRCLFWGKMMADPTPQKRSTPIWLRVLLVASLAANLAVIGVVIGAATSSKGPRNPERIAGDVGAAPFVRALEPEDRRALARDVIRERGGFRDIRRETQARAQALFAALRAETFDRAEVEALLDAQRDAAKLRQTLGEQALLDRLEAMTHDERVAYAERLAQHLRHGPGRGKPRD